MTVCSHKESGKFCPISKTPCLGECIYANILDDISLGIIGIDAKKQEVFYQNKLAIELFKDTIKPKEYRALASTLLFDNESCIPVNVNESRTLQYGSRFIGYTVYRISEIYFWIYVSDITEKVRLNTIAEAVNTMNNLGYFFSGIRHELGNPINSIKTTMTVLNDNIENYSKETVVKYIERVLHDINRVEYLLRELKTFSMFEKPECKDIHIPSFMFDLLSMVERDFTEKHIDVSTIFPQEVEWVYADPRALQHVMLNILTNASDALQTITAPEIVISTSKMGNRIIIKVKDSGCGIPEEQKGHLFKPFMTTKRNGTGLGLVIVKKILSQMDSTVDIESEENIGTVVTVNLPEGRARHE
jgi:signal transduction histidine kinase